MNIKIRYKRPGGEESKLLIKPVIDQQIALENTSNNFRFSAAVAAFGMVLRNSAYKQGATYEDVIALAKNATGKDINGYRHDFIEMVQQANGLSVAKK